MSQLKFLAKGLITWVPGIRERFFDDGERLPASGSYSYGVWLKHLTLLWQYGMKELPREVLELGPGSSLGTGVAALLSGAERYYGVDAVAHAEPEHNRKAMREVVACFRERAPRPVKGWPSFDQYLDRNLFPGHILTARRLREALDAPRLARIEQAVADAGTPAQSMIHYRTWDEPDPVALGSIDLVFSHAVLNHVDDLNATYAHCARWLRPGGWMSHQLDFTAMETADDWNGHLAFSERTWRIMAGRRPYYVNRERLSTHRELLRTHGFALVADMRRLGEGGLSRARLAPRWRHISDDDLATRTAFLIARRMPRLH